MIGRKIPQNKFGRIILMLYLCLTLNKNIMEYKVLTSSSPEGLTEKVNKYINEGFVPVGSHQVVTQREVNRYSGSQHMDTLITQEYSQTLIKQD